MAKQMTIDERKRIDFLLQLGWTPVQIAKEMGRSKTTIIREIINRSVACDRGYRCSNRICVNDITEWTELDTVIGRVGGKVLFTMILPGGLMLMFLRDRKSSQTCTRVFNMLWKLAGPELFRSLFSVILTDIIGNQALSGIPDEA